MSIKKVRIGFRSLGLIGHIFNKLITDTLKHTFVFGSKGTVNAVFNLSTV